MENLNENYKNSFEEQFSKKKIFDVLDGKIEATDVEPDILKTKTPILIAPGWASTPETLRDSIKIFYEKGRHVISLAHSRKGISENLMDSELRQKYTADELRKALSILKLLEEKSIDKVDVVAHSEGAINTTIAASLAPEKFRNIIFVAPGGLIGKDAFPKLASRFIYGTIRDFLVNIFSKDFDKTRGSNVFKETLKYLSANPTRALQESIAISKSQIQDMIKNLRDKGIGIAIMSGIDDSAFPMDKMQKNIKIDQLDGFVSLKGSHNEIIDRPDKYASAADELLDMLEKKHLVK